MLHDGLNVLSRAVSAGMRGSWVPLPVGFIWALRLQAGAIFTIFCAFVASPDQIHRCSMCFILQSIQSIALSTLEQNQRQCGVRTIDICVLRI